MSKLYRPKRVPAFTVPKVTRLSLSGSIRPAGSLGQNQIGSAPNFLRVGIMGMDGRTVSGPGDVSTPPYYGVAQLSALQEGANLVTALNSALANNVRIILNITGSPGSFGANTSGGFDQAAYRANLDDIYNDVSKRNAITAMVQQGMLGFWVADEPNHDKWDSTTTGQATFTPDLLNQCGLDHKSRWPGVATYVRTTNTILKAGWGGFHIAASGYTGIDYGWCQYARTHIAANLTPIQAYNQELNVGLTMTPTVGCTFSLNLWAAGPWNDFDGVTACWDYDLNAGTPDGIVVGIAGTVPLAGHSAGDQISCATKTADGVKVAIASPAWMRRNIDELFSHPSLPEFLMWTWPDPSAAGVAFGDPATYMNRSDYVSALSYMLNKGKQRTSYLPRTIK